MVAAEERARVALAVEEYAPAFQAQGAPALAVLLLTGRAAVDAAVHAVALVAAEEKVWRRVVGAAKYWVAGVAAAVGASVPTLVPMLVSLARWPARRPKGGS